MPSTQLRHLLTALLLLCLCTQGAVAAVAAPHPEAATGCFPGVNEVERDEAVGDVVELEMLLCFSGSVTVSGPAYTANASLGDGNWSGGVTVAMDTRLNGSRALSVTTDRDHTVAMNATGNGSFQPGTYTVTVRDWDGEVVETVEFTLGRPRAEDLTLFRAPEGAAADLDSVAALREARAVSATDSARRFDDPNFTDTLEVATNETLVVAVRADGLEATVENGTGTPLSRFRAAVDAAGGSLTLRQTEETVTVEREPLSPDLLNDSATHLVPDPDNDTYYFVVDTRRLQGEWGGSHGGSVTVGARPGMGYAARFSMQNETDAVPSDLVAADFTVVEAAVAGPADAADGPLMLQPTENASLRLRTTLASGTPVTVEVAGLPDGPLNRTARVRRVDDGTAVTLDLNLSGVPNGTNLTVTAQRDGEQLDSEVKAAVGTTSTPTETRTTQPPTESETASRKPTTSSSAPDSPTLRPVPGLGALQGVAALLLGVLALRRRN